MLGTFLLICAAIGVIGAFLSWLWEKSEGFLSSLLSYFMKGIGYGVILFTIMFVGWLLSFFRSWDICGVNPFWIGFCIGVVVEAYNLVRRLILR